MRSRNIAAQQHRNAAACGCSIQPPPPRKVNCKGLDYAESYIRMQSYNSIFDPVEALCEGTLFPELNRHFC